MTKTPKPTIPKKEPSPGQRWIASRFPPPVPAYLPVIETNAKREDKSGVLWRRHIAHNAWFPDATDPATLGVLSSYVRAAWAMPTGITVTYSDDEALWKVSWCGATHGGWCGTGTTEGAALVAALEATP